MENRTQKILIGAAAVGEGVAKISYGLVRGGLAISMGLGHGISGAFMKNHHAMGLAVKMAEHSWEKAEKAIEEGAEAFEEGIDIWRDR